MISLPERKFWIIKTCHYQDNPIFVSQWDSPQKTWFCPGFALVQWHEMSWRILGRYNTLESYHLQRRANFWSWSPRYWKRYLFSRAPRCFVLWSNVSYPLAAGRPFVIFQRANERKGREERERGRSNYNYLLVHKYIVLIDMAPAADELLLIHHTISSTSTSCTMVSNISCYCPVEGPNKIRETSSSAAATLLILVSSRRINWGSRP